MGRSILVAVVTLIFFVVQGCSLKSMALQTTSELLTDASQEIETEENWKVFKDSVPASLKTLEGILYAEPTNENLLISLIKGYGSYGFAVYETLHLEEKFSDADKMPHKAMAIDHYLRSINYGLRWLKTKDLEIKNLAAALKDNRGFDFLDETLDSDDPQHLEGAFFLGQSWLSYINLQRNRPALVAQLFIVKALFDWTCKHQPDFRLGSCYVFYGAYEASRPKMLGGNPQKGAEIFEQAIKKFPGNLFLRMAFIEYYAIPAMDIKTYRSQVKSMTSWIASQSKLPPIPGKGPISTESKKQTGQIFNSIAAQRFKIVRQYEKEIF